MSRILNSIDSNIIGKDTEGRLVSRHGFRAGDHGKQIDLPSVKTGSFFRPISSDRKKSGARPHCSLIDEIHEHEDANTVDMLRALAREF